MRLRPDVAIGLGGVVLLALVVVLLGPAGTPGEHEMDRRRSTFSRGPFGARGLADALERLQINVDRYRGRPPGLPEAARRNGVSAVAVLDPSRPFTVREALPFLAATEQGVELVVAGPSANALSRCMGYIAQPRADSVRAFQSNEAVGTRESAMWVRAVLGRIGDSVVVDSGTRPDGGQARCEVPRPERVDTLLLTQGGRLVAARLAYPDRAAVTLVSDGMLFGNRNLRVTDAGIFALQLFVGQHSRVMVDEYHHGFGTQGSLAGAVVRWSLTSPWGWAVWQLAVVGTLALVASGIRFGTATVGRSRRRRSRVEHVQALATALAAIHGHRVAVGLLIRGLQRRLSLTGATRYPDPETWLAALAPSLRTSAGHAALNRLQTLTRGSEPSAHGVLAAAHAVEDLWQDLRP